MATSAKIVFLGACNIDDAFQTWWNINSDTPDQALVVPTTVGPTGLYAAANVWRYIQQEMMSGYVSLKKAVDDATRHFTYPVKFKVVGGQDGATIFLR